MLKKLKPISILIAIVSIILFIGFYDYIIQKWPFIPYFDSRTQYRQYFSEFTRLIINSLKYKAFPFWSWNFFLGNNFWASKSYQLLGDIFAYVTLLVSGHVFNKILIVTLLKYFVSALAFFGYLKYRNVSYKTQIIGALLYSFSSYILRFTEQPFFVTFYVLIPIYLISVEQILHKKRPYLFIFMVGFMTVTNYYLFYTTTLFSIIYFVYRSYELKLELKKSVSLFLSFILYYLIGFLLSTFIILPTFYSIINNPRVGNVTSNLFYYSDVKTYFNIIMSILLPMQSSLNGMFYSSEYSLESYIWAGSIITLLLPQVFFDINKYNKKINSFLFIVLSFFLLLPLGGIIMHGFSNPTFRWEFIVLIFNIIVILPFIDNPQLINKKVLLISIIIIITMIIFGFILFNLITNFSINFESNQILIYCFYLTFYIVNFIVLYYKKDSINFKNYILFLLIFELIFTTTLTFNKPSAKVFNWDTINKVESVLGDEGELTRHLQTFDASEEFYRVYVPYESVYWIFSLNMNLIYDFMDTKTYDTTYQTTNNDLFRIIENEFYYDWFIDITNPNVIDFIGVKYALVREKGELPHENFTYLGTFNYLEVYQNNNFEGLFKSYNKILTYEDYSLINDPSLINTCIILNNEDYDEVNSLINISDYNYSIKNAEKYQNMLITYANNTEDIFVVSNIAFDEGWEVSINNVKVKAYSTNGGFLAFSVPANGGEIKFYFMPKGFKVGIIISILSSIVFLIVIAYCEFKRRNKKLKSFND